jgi:AraC-like DNA-binding protein/quercetin dioxygenase-like cupin family protein
MKSRLPSARASQAAPEFFSADVTEARRFYLDLHPPKNGRLAVVCGGLERCNPDYAIDRKTFPFYSLEYVARGRGEVTLKGHTHSLQPGCLLSYGPGVPHRITGDKADTLVKYFVDFTGTRATVLLRSCGLSPGRVSEVVPANALQPLFDELIQAGLRVRRESGMLCAKLLECLALRIAGAHASPASAETQAFATFQRCRSHIEQHSLRLRTLGQIAGECHVNNAYLCRLFRRYDSQSPCHYLLRLKMNYAAQRLQQHDALVKKVAAEAGFDDPFHFSRAFTSVFGLSPSAFRGLR